MSIFDSRFTDEKTKAQRGDVTDPEPMAGQVNGRVRGPPSPQPRKRVYLQQPQL